MKMSLAAFLCAAVFVLVSPLSIRALDSSAGTATRPATSAHSISMNGASTLALAHRRAMSMVPASAELLDTVDARKLHTGDIVQARLQQDIHLKDGTELPRGTVLTGRITQDNSGSGNVRLALRFDHATLKNGSSVPIRAMIASIQPGSSSIGSLDVSDELSPWTPSTYNVEQLSVVTDTNLNSSITSSNSGVFSSSRKKNVVIRKGAELMLALGSRQRANPIANSAS